MKYLIKLSNKTDIQIDEDEVEIVLQGITTGKAVKVRQGIFNPSFYIAIIEDLERVGKYQEALNSWERTVNRIEENKPRLGELKDIFNDYKKLT